MGKNRSRNKNMMLRIQNEEIYRYYKERIISAALSQFEWHGAPSTCDMLYFERELFFRGQAAIYNVSGTDTWLSTGFVQKSQFSVYGYPLDISGVGYNQAGIPVDKFMVCRDNVMWESLLPKVDLYARMLYEVHNTFRSNLKQQNTPYIVKSDRNTLLSVRNFFNNLFGFDPVLEVRPTFNQDDISALDLRVDFKGREMLECLDKIWQQAMSMLGITQQDTKKERMLKDEIAMNRMADVTALYTRLSTRVDFCNRMNELTGWDLSVNLTADKFDLAPYEEGDNYDDSTDDDSTNDNTTDDDSTNDDSTGVR